MVHTLCIIDLMPLNPSSSKPLRGRPQTSDRLIVAILAATGIAVSLTQTLVLPIIGELPTIFDTSPATASWVITITLFTGAISNPVVGRLADMHGKKQLMLISLLPFIIGSATAALAQDIITIIIGRALQGFALGLIPLAISLLHDVLPREKVGSAIALMSSSLGIGGSLGLPLAAAIAQFANWQIMFWTTGAFGVLLFIAIWYLIPQVATQHSNTKFDYFGTLGIIVGLVALLLAISQGTEWGWNSPSIIGLAIFAIAALTLWGWYQLRSPEPLVNLKTAARPVVLLTNIVAILIGFTMYGLNLIFPQIMQLASDTGYGLGQSMLQMGLWLAPIGLGMMLVSNLGARISFLKGPRVTLTISGVVIAAGYAISAIVLATVGNRSPADAADDTSIMITLVLLSLCGGVVGCGIGLAFGSMPTLIMSAVPLGEKASSNGFNNLMRSLGTTSAAAVIGAVLAAMTKDGVPTHTGFLVSLLIGGGSAAVATIIAYFIPAKGGYKQTPVEAGPTPGN